VLAGEQVSGGQVFENAIAVQLKTQGTIQYYQRKNGQEIDFIFNGNTAIEVKETAIKSDRQTLLQRADSIGLKKQVLISRYNAGSGFEDFIWGGSIF